MGELLTAADLEALPPLSRISWAWGCVAHVRLFAPGTGLAWYLAQFDPVEGAAYGLARFDPEDVNQWGLGWFYPLEMARAGGQLAPVRDTDWKPRTLLECTFAEARHDPDDWVNEASISLDGYQATPRVPRAWHTPDELAALTLRIAQKLRETEGK